MIRSWKKCGTFVHSRRPNWIMISRPYLNAPAVEPSRLSSGQQIALFPESSPFLDELTQLDVNALTPLQAINKLYEWKQRYVNNER